MKNPNKNNFKGGNNMIKNNMNIGFISGCSNRRAEAFLQDIAIKLNVDEESRLIFSKRTVLCSDCLQDFISEHKLDILFVSDSIVFGCDCDGMDKNYDVIFSTELDCVKSISKEMGCKIFVAVDTRKS